MTLGARFQSCVCWFWPQSPLPLRLRHEVAPSIAFVLICRLVLTDMFQVKSDKMSGVVNRASHSFTRSGRLCLWQVAVLPACRTYGARRNGFSEKPVLRPPASTVADELAQRATRPDING